MQETETIDTINKFISDDLKPYVVSVIEPFHRNAANIGKYGIEHTTLKLFRNAVLACGVKGSIFFDSHAKDSAGLPPTMIPAISTAQSRLMELYIHNIRYGKSPFPNSYKQFKEDLSQLAAEAFAVYKPRDFKRLESWMQGMAGIFCGKHYLEFTYPGVYIFNLTDYRLDREGIDTYAHVTTLHSRSITARFAHYCAIQVKTRRTIDENMDYRTSLSLSSGEQLTSRGRYAMRPIYNSQLVKGIVEGWIKSGFQPTQRLDDLNILLHNPSKTKGRMCQVLYLETYPRKRLDTMPDDDRKFQEYI